MAVTRATLHREQRPQPSRIQQSELGIELLQTAYIEAFCRDIFGITEEVSSITTPFDPNVKLSKADLPTSEKDKKLLAGIGTDFQVADVFTKPLAHSKFASFRNVLCGYRTFENLMNSN